MSTIRTGNIDRAEQLELLLLLERQRSAALELQLFVERVALGKYGAIGVRNDGELVYPPPPPEERILTMIDGGKDAPAAAPPPAAEKGNA